MITEMDPDIAKIKITFRLELSSILNQVKSIRTK